MLNFLDISGISFDSLTALDFLRGTVDFIITFLLFYLFFVAVKSIKTQKITAGFAFLVIILWLSYYLEFRTLGFIFGSEFRYALLVLLIIFREEVRRMFLTISSINLFNSFEQDEDVNVIKELADALDYMASVREGALVVILPKSGRSRTAENDANIGTIADGTVVDGLVTDQLLRTIFFKNSPLHDGAVIIENKRITRASVFFSLSTNPNIDPNFGTRHRAAYGISEKVQDAIVLVVSEERGEISLLQGGRITRDLNKDALKEQLKNRI